MAFHLHIDSITRMHPPFSGLVVVRGWCLDASSSPCSDLVCRVGRSKVPVSREWRRDLVDTFTENPESGWGGFHMVCACGPGLRRIGLWSGQECLWSGRVFSFGLGRICEGRVWSLAAGGVEGVSAAPLRQAFGRRAKAHDGPGGMCSATSAVKADEGRAGSYGPASHRAARPILREYVASAIGCEVDVVGVFYGRSSSADDWFASLASAREVLPRLRVFVVEHGPEPVVRDLVDKWSERLSLEWRHNPSNPGFGAGCNAGASLGKAPFLFFLNPDAVLTPGSLERLVERAEADSPDGFVAWEAGQMPWEHPKLYHPLTGETEWSSAAAWLLRRDAFEAVGGFDENIFLYGEDVDLSWRLRAAGGRLAYVPGVRVRHESYGGDEVASGKALQVREGRHSDAYLRGKFGGLRDCFSVDGFRVLSRHFWKGRKRWFKLGAGKVRFLPSGYEVERPGCGREPLRTVEHVAPVVLRVGEVEDGFERGVWEAAVAAMTDVRVVLEWIAGAAVSAEPASRVQGSPPVGGWVFDAWSNWMLFPDALAQMMAAATAGGVEGVRGRGLVAPGRIDGGRWQIERFAGGLPHPDPGHGFRPGVSRRKDEGKVLTLSKGFWLEAAGSIRRQGG